MEPSKSKIDSLLQKIHDKITNLCVEECFRKIVSEDIEGAITCFKEKNILSVINYTTGLVDKLQTYVLFSCGRHSDIKRLLICIHCLQQTLTKLPVCTVGPSGPPGPVGPPGPPGPPGPASTTTVITSTHPVSDFQDLRHKEDPEDSCHFEQVPVKPKYFDSSFHVIHCRNSNRKW